MLLFGLNALNTNTCGAETRQMPFTMPWQNYFKRLKAALTKIGAFMNPEAVKIKFFEFAEL